MVKYSKKYNGKSKNYKNYKNTKTKCNGQYKTKAITKKYMKGGSKVATHSSKTGFRTVGKRPMFLPSESTPVSRYETETDNIPTQELEQIKNF